MLEQIDAADPTLSLDATGYVPNLSCKHCGENLYYELPTYEFWDSVEVCRYCKRRFHLRIGSMVTVPTRGFGTPRRLEYTQPVTYQGKYLAGGRLLLNEPVVPPEVAGGLYLPTNPGGAA